MQTPYKKAYLFSFLRYIKPTWYFNLKSDFPLVTWISEEQLASEEKALINTEEVYSSDEARQADIAWQAWQKGFLKKVSEGEKGLQLGSIRVQDEYRFVARYFNRIWLFYILLVRLVGLKNPIYEISSFIRALEIKRINPSQQTPDKSDVKSFDSELLKKNLLVSVVIPTLNRYKYLEDVMKDLEMQTYSNFEVLVCDQSEPCQESYYEAFNLNIRLFPQQEKALWLARNRCIKESKGELILLFDDDSRVDSDWIEMHIRCLDYFKADISAGISISTVGAKVPSNYNCYRWSDQLDTGNAMLYKTVFEKTGLFDRQFEKQRMGDGEFGMRCYLSGFVNINNPDACRLHLKVSSGGLRQMGSWDAFRPKKLLSPRPIPSVLYYANKYFGRFNSILWLLITVPPSIIPYKWKGSKLLMLMGFVFLPLILPFILLQVIISWRMASLMLQEGAKIESYIIDVNQVME
ncbi:glycosyltransferase family A protein [Carboxylicivirga linearis]|uniref:Glycosyltransferase family 2 protein n=1 Tax=Carboxylicivirga linearis TaxID=1628157 RepID=A0ABS5JVZ8_9BACT|nr:glycosyltransferase family A protein [Carboxylicivirga linearis]MBS2099072.1 glycosyltransferase family 2 protein [Carboxylicivirga linearis]